MLWINTLVMMNHNTNKYMLFSISISMVTFNHELISL